MPPLLVDLIHARACKPFCEKSLTLPEWQPNRSAPGTHRLCQAGPVRLVQCAKQQKSHAPGGVAVWQ